MAILKIASRQTTSMTPRVPPPSKDKIDTVFRRLFDDDNDDAAGMLSAGEVGVRKAIKPSGKCLVVKDANFAP